MGARLRPGPFFVRRNTMTDETQPVEETEPQPEPQPEVVDLCDRCDCDDCPGTSPDTTAELAQHSKACPEKHY